MTAGALAFAVNRSSQEQILGHLVRCDQQFIPPLSTRTDIGVYAAKIRGHAHTFEAWERGCLVGLVAAYFNGRENSCFITSVSVLPEQTGKGVAGKLVAACLEKARGEGLATFFLEVSEDNLAAIHLYDKFGFRVTGSRGGALSMEWRDGETAEPGEPKEMR